MVANILKYGSTDLIILYCYTYFKLLGTMKIVVQNSIRSIRAIEFSPMRNSRFDLKLIGIECNPYRKRMVRVWMSDSM